MSEPIELKIDARWKWAVCGGFMMKSQPKPRVCGALPTETR